MKVYRQLASLVEARANCVASGNDEWRQKHEEAIATIAVKHLPRGAGFDVGTRVDLDESTADRLVLTTSFHHMDQYGGYDGWTEHVVVVTPSLARGFAVDVKGVDRNDIQGYIADVVDAALDEETP